MQRHASTNQYVILRASWLVLLLAIALGGCGRYGFDPRGRQDGGVDALVDGAWVQTTSATTTHLSAVWGIGPNDVWAVGYGGLIVHR